MKRREMLQTLGSASVLGLFSNTLSARTRARDVRPFTARGQGPALIVFERPPQGYYDRLTDRYRVVVIDNSAFDNSPANIASRAADRECADILAVADAAGVDRFAWFGFSFGSVVGLQLASRTSRVSALVCGGWASTWWPICRDPGLYRRGSCAPILKRSNPAAIGNLVRHCSTLRYPGKKPTHGDAKRHY